uniref:Defensin-like protein 166 n=1 Tax=Arabidopsis thaliana TaxID=3702 RepID=DF166_ARATH|nr:PUTATIVE PSEUDOGENE: RecName: Full=Defensin-like protein 166; Flags: Precursor [Arabidopsis thaliana]
MIIVIIFLVIYFNNQLYMCVSSTCVIQWCAIQCKRKEANGIGTCKPRPNQGKIQYRKLKEECHCVYKCS